MTLTGHLEELRSRIITSVVTWVIVSCVCYSQVDRILGATRPLLGSSKLIFSAPTDAFFAYIKMAMIAGLFISSPVLLYQALMFIVPGLEKHERKWLFRLLPVAVFLFLCGACFAFFAVLPVTMKFFLSFANPESKIEAYINIQDFLGFVVGLLAVCGVIFQLPLVLMAGALVGIVKSSFLRKQRRLAIFLAFVVAAIATPTPDAFTCSVVALPIIILFEISVILIRIMGK